MGGGGLTGGVARKVRCIASSEGSEMIKRKERERGEVREEEADSGFLRGNLHVKKHSGKTVPAGNWSLIGSEVERDQLAGAGLQGRRG